MSAPARKVRRIFTRDSIERALDQHLAAGRITGWDRIDGARYRIGLNRRSGDLYLTPAEVHLVLAGLASAGYAPTSQEG